MAEQPENTAYRTWYGKAASLAWRALLAGLRRLNGWRWSPETRAPSAKRLTRSFEAVLPCRGEVFHFTAQVHLLWSAQGDIETAKEWIEHHEPAHRLHLQACLRAIAREFPHDECGEAERRMNDELRVEWVFDGGKLTCRAWVHLYSDQFVREHLREVWEARSTLAERHELAKRAIPQIRERQAIWRKFLSEVPIHDNVALYTLGLSVDSTNLLEVSKDMLRQHKAEVERLERLCERSIATHQQLDLYEFVMSHNYALRNLLDYVGVADQSEHRPLDTQERLASGA